MAVISQGFSIREYTAKMRVVDVEKCWPFSCGGGGDKEQVVVEAATAFLPPISVKKFRWWFHEVNKINQQVQDDQDHDFDGIPGEEKKEEDEENLEIVCPVCGNFTAESMEVGNAHVDICQSNAKREKKKKLRIPFKSKSKSKSPKKRSILEIFAVSPQVEKVDDDDGGGEEKEDDDDGNEDCFLDGQAQAEDEKKKKMMMTMKKKKKKKKKKKIKINSKNKKLKKVTIGSKLTMEKKTNKYIKKKEKNKRKKTKINNKWSIANKENAHKLKLLVPVNCSKEANGSVCNKGITKAILDDLSVHRNKSGHKDSVQKKNGVQPSKYIAKHQKTFLPVRGILKNHSKVIPQQNFETCNISGGSQANCFEFQYPDRHVRFSGKDDILGPMNNNFSSSEENISDTYLDSLTNQSEKENSIETDKESDPVGVNGNDISVNAGNSTGLLTKINKKQLSGINDPVHMPDFLRPQPEKEKHIMDISSASPVMIHGNDLHMFAQGYPAAPNEPRNASILRLLPAANEAHNPYINSQLCSDVSMASDSRGKSIDYFQDHTHELAAVDSLASTRAFGHPTSSNFPSVERLNKSFLCMPQSSIKSISGQALQNQPYRHLSPVGFMGPDWRQTVGASGERCMSGQFGGLPLNSHGELIQVNSSGRVGLDQLQKSSRLSSSSSSYPYNPVMPGSFNDFASGKHHNEQAFPRDRLNLQPIQKNHNVHLPARFGVSELPNTAILDVYSLNSGRGSGNSVCAYDSNLSSMNTSLEQCWQYIQNQNEKGTQMDHMKEKSNNMPIKTVQPTMRLMGKDVAVGRSTTETQGFEDGNIWMDKEIIREHRPSSNDLGNSLLKREIQQDWILYPAQEKSKETLHFPVEFESNQASQSNIEMKALESRHPEPNDWKIHSTFRNGDFTINWNACSQMHPTPHPSSLDMLYKGASLHDSSISVTENAGTSSQVPIMSTSLNAHPHICWRPVELNYQQNPPNARRSTFDFPFLHPDSNEHIQSAPFPSSSKNLPPWLVHATMQVKTAAMPSQNFSDVGDKHHPCTTNGANFLTPLHHSSVVSYPHNSVISSPPLRSSLGSASFVKPPVFPFSTGVHPNSSLNMNYRDKIIVEDRMKLNAFAVKVPDHCQKLKKRPAAIASGSLRPSKMRSLMQEDLSAVTEATRETCKSEIWHNIAAYEHISKGNEGINLGCSSFEAQKIRLGSSHDIDYSKADTSMKSGPIKLTAGAKHILKPSRNMDQDNSRLIHSTIPFPGVTDCDSLLDSEKTSTMIYRF